MIWTARDWRAAFTRAHPLERGSRSHSEFHSL